MSGFQAIVIGLLVSTLARSYANGHDIRGDWVGSERVVCVVTMLSGHALAGLGVWWWIS